MSVSSILLNRKYFLLFFISFSFVLTASAQSPVIRAGQYTITITGNFPAENNPDITGYNRTYSLNTGGCSYLQSSVSYSGPGTFTNVFNVSETNRPECANLVHSVGSLYYQCETYWGICSGSGGVTPASHGVSINPDAAGQIGRYVAGNGQPTYQWCTTCWYSPISVGRMNAYVNLRYPEFDTTISVRGSTVSISVRKSTDNNFNLPSKEPISILALTSTTNCVWQYQVLEPNGTASGWYSVPSSLVQSDNSAINVSGETLFASYAGGYMSQLNKTVIFRLLNQTNGDNSNLLVYTHRLSSPSIVSVTPYNNRCYGMDSGYVKVKLSRALLANEKVNLFLKDTVLGLDYSALNLTNANIDANLEFLWPKELIAGKYKMSMIGKYFDVATYTGSSSHFAFCTITEPELLRYYVGGEPVLCYGNNSGKVKVAAKGGVGNYSYELKHIDSSFNGAFQAFSNQTFNYTMGTWEQMHSNLVSNTYKVRLRDGNNCIIKDSTGAELCKYVKVAQPNAAMYMSMFDVYPITSSDSANGGFKIRLSGGTPFNGVVEVPTLAYSYSLTDSATGQAVTSTLDTTANKFEVSLKNSGPKTYRLQAWDANNNLMPQYDQKGCRVDAFIRLTRPEPLSVVLETQKPIRCNAENNGVLRANAKGGVWIVDTARYEFVWYKKNGTTFTNLNVNDSLLRNVGPGTYKAEIIDKFRNRKTSNEFLLAEPVPLTTTSSFTAPSCYYSLDGTMTANVTGGTQPYTYNWSNGALTQSVTKVAGGEYVVVVTDANMCQSIKQVVVTTPARVIAAASISPVSCNATSTGSAILSASGGAGGYTYKWSTGSTTSSLSNLPAGDYWYKVTDSKGCYDSANFTLANPALYTVNAGADKIVCTGQTALLNATVSDASVPVSLSWTGPQGSQLGAQFSVTTPGSYIVSASNSTGCVKRDTVVVTRLVASVNTGFTVSSQAFASENTTLVNISPQLQDSVQWIVPISNGIRKVSSSKNYCELVFADTGMYYVGIRAYYSSGCIDEKFKEVHVVKKTSFGYLGSQSEAFIKQFSVSPNPTTGAITLNILFNDVTVARVRIINILTNVNISDRSLQGAASYTDQYNLAAQPAGTYIILIETPKGSYVHKLNKL